MYNNSGGNMYNMSILKSIRKNKGYTIYKMAKLLEITPSFYSQIENKKRRLFYDTAYKIAKVLDMKPDEIFYNINKNS